MDEESIKHSDVPDDAHCWVCRRTKKEFEVEFKARLDEDISDVDWFIEDVMCGDLYLCPFCKFLMGARALDILTEDLETVLDDFILGRLKISLKDEDEP